MDRRAHPVKQFRNRKEGEEEGMIHKRESELAARVTEEKIIQPVTDGYRNETKVKGIESTSLQCRREDAKQEKKGPVRKRYLEKAVGRVGRSYSEGTVSQRRERRVHPRVNRNGSICKHSNQRLVVEKRRRRAQRKNSRGIGGVSCEEIELFTKEPWIDPGGGISPLVEKVPQEGRGGEVFGNQKKKKRKTLVVVRRERCQK